MKKKLLLATILIIMGASMTGCNAQLVDTTFKFDRAVISLPNGEVVEGKVDSWRDYDNSDQIQDFETEGRKNKKKKESR